MSRIVLTLVGADRAGLVAAVADVVSAHDGNWEASQLAELGGTFAGVVQVEVPDAQRDALLSALHELDGLLAIATHPAAEAPASTPAPEQSRGISVLGNDRPGIVREISSTLSAHGVSIDRLSTQVRDAAMSGGALFDAGVSARVPQGADLDALRDALEQLAGEIQVDITIA
mgnify:FL=1